MSDAIGGTAVNDEARWIGARFRDVAMHWALDAHDAASLLGIEGSAAAALLEDGSTMLPPGEAEHRMRIAVHIDDAMRRAFQVHFNALVWLRLGASPSRLQRLFGDLREMRSVRREAEELSQ